MQQVGCITIFLCSMVATCESNENGRFSTQLGLAKPSLEGRIENVVFLGKTKLFRGKKYSLFVFLLGASYMQKGSEFEFASLAEEI